MDEKKTIRDIFEESVRAKELFLSDDANIETIAGAANLIIKSIRKGGKVIVFGNGGSAADSQHIAAEFVVRFEKERRSLPCIALTANSSVLTAAANDYDFEKIFARQIEALGKPSDVVIAISTSGESKNVLQAVRAARKINIPVIAITGGSGGKLKKESEIAIVACSKNTARIQEIHITAIHAICKVVEDAFACEGL